MISMFFNFICTNCDYAMDIVLYTSDFRETSWKLGSCRAAVYLQQSDRVGFCHTAVARHPSIWAPRADTRQVTNIFRTIPRQNFTTLHCYTEERDIRESKSFKMN
jgi:hypothetical protein